MGIQIAKTILLSFTCLLLLSKAVLGQSNQHLKQAIQRSLTAEKLTGAVWTVVDSDGQIHTASAGIKDNDSKELLRPTDRVHVGSVAKTVLAAGILHLATIGKLNIDDPVNKYLPTVSFINPWEDTNPITLRHLLDHTSGLSDVRLWHVFSTTAIPKGQLSEFFAHDPSILQIQARPGSIFSYSNMGYTLLGMVVESVTKIRYEAYLDESVLEPLGMRNSTSEFVTQIGDFADKDLAMGHFDNGETSPALPVYVRPAGQFTTTASDMGIFLKFMMSDGRINGRDFIKKAFLDELGIARTDAAKNGLPDGYGLGAYSRDRHGVRGIVHGGHILGFRTMIYLFPEEQKAFFISHNTDSETADYNVFDRILIKHLGIPGRVPEASRPTSAELAAWNGYYAPAINKVMPFGLVDYIMAFTKVTVKSNGAVLKPFQKTAISLTYTGNHKFMAEERTVPSHIFHKSDGDRHLISTGLGTLRKVNGSLILLGAISFLAGLTGLVYLLLSGTYQILKFRRHIWKQPLIWCFSAVFLILLSIVFLIFQPFITIGDLTVGSFLLASGTVLLPLFTVISIYKYALAGWYAKADLVSLFFLLQLLIVLILNGLIPFVLWK